MSGPVSVPGTPTQMRKVGGGRTRILTVPSFLARHVPEDSWFVAEFTDEGILFRAVDGPSEPDRTPSWAKRNGAKS